MGALLALRMTILDSTRFLSVILAPVPPPTDVSDAIVSARVSVAENELAAPQPRRIPNDAGRLSSHHGQRRGLVQADDGSWPISVLWIVPA